MCGQKAALQKGLVGCGRRGYAAAASKQPTKVPYVDK